MITITNKHKGVTLRTPVILDDKGKIMETGPGIQAIRYQLEMTAAEFGIACGVSWRTVNGWEQGRPPTVGSLMLMANLLKEVKA